MCLMTSKGALQMVVVDHPVPWYNKIKRLLVQLMQENHCTLLIDMTTIGTFFFNTMKKISILIVVTPIITFCLALFMIKISKNVI